MIRVAVVDRQPTVRAGLDAIVAAQSDLVAVGGAADARELWPLLHRARPDVVVLDASPAPEALALCLQVKSRLLGPRVVLFGAAVTSEAIVPAALAGADAIADKAADVRDLLHAIRAVARGEHALPRFTPRLQAQAAARLSLGDRAIFAMRLAGTAQSEIAATVGMSVHDLGARTTAILAALSSDRGPLAAERTAVG
jgi:DNA-binding NarL/FixJ family response regulator